MTAFRYNTVLSLGPTCLPAMQARQVFDRLLFQNGPFNYQISPMSAVTSYLRDGLAGTMERADLSVDADGLVRNDRYGTCHPHEFPEGLGSFEAAKSRHDYLCAKLRRLLADPTSRILFLSGHDDPAIIDRAIREAYPKLRFRLLTVVSSAPQAVWHEPVAEWHDALRQAERSFGESKIRTRHRLLWRHMKLGLSRALWRHGVGRRG
jgi:hypothetical protein